MVKRARELEVQYMDELKVLEDSDRDACMAEIGRPPIPTDWVDINKGDALRPNYSSRLVCQETVQKIGRRRSLQLLRTRHSDCSLMMTGPRSQVEGDDDVLMLLGFSRAHLHSPLARVVFVTIDGKSTRC